MKVSVFLAIILVTGLNSQYTSAHSGAGFTDGFLDLENCNHTVVEGVWRINTKGKQTKMVSAAYLSFARIETSTNTETDEWVFVVTGNGFGKLDKTPVYFTGSCEDQFGVKVYVLRGTIEVDGTEQTVAVTPHPDDLYTERDDDCETRSTGDRVACIRAVHDHQSRYISINTIEVKRTEGSKKIESKTNNNKDPGDGHAHGGGSN